MGREVCVCGCVCGCLTLTDCMKECPLHPGCLCSPFSFFSIGQVRAWHPEFHKDQKRKVHDLETAELDLGVSGSTL